MLLPIKKLIYEINSPVELPFQSRIPITTLRGAFGYSLLQVIARDEAIGQSEKVTICKHLFYSDDISQNSTHINAARPFVMRGGFTRPDNKSFILEMLLFGNAISAEKLVDKIIKNMCKMGLGNQNLVCNCIKLGSEDITPVIPELSSSCIVNYQTPTRIKQNNKYFKEGIPFSNLFARLADRLEELQNVYTNEGFNIDLSDLKEKSKQIGMIVNEGNFYEATRKSTRTGDDCDLSGFTGSILYTGNLEPFSEILSYLPWINVESSTAFGCGWCTLEYNKNILTT